MATTLLATVWLVPWALRRGNGAWRLWCAAGACALLVSAALIAWHA
jgi:hypothetical protein